MESQMSDMLADDGASALPKRPHDPIEDGPEASEGDRSVKRVRLGDEDQQAEDFGLELSEDEEADTLATAPAAAVNGSPSHTPHHAGHHDADQDLLEAAATSTSDSALAAEHMHVDEDAPRPDAGTVAEPRAAAEADQERAANVGATSAGPLPVAHTGGAVGADAVQTTAPDATVPESKPQQVAPAPVVATPAPVHHNVVEVEGPDIVSGLRQRRAEQGRLKYCEKHIMRTLWRHPEAWPFHKPVDTVKLGLHDYHTIIKKPMDMGAIKSKLQRAEYMAADEVVADFELMFSNCRLYNRADSDVVKMCNSVEKALHELVANMPGHDAPLDTHEHAEPQSDRKSSSKKSKKHKEGRRKNEREGTPLANGTREPFAVPRPPASSAKPLVLKTTTRRSVSPAAVASPAPVATPMAAPPSKPAVPVPVRTAAQVLAARRSSVVGGIELDLDVNLNEKLLENRPKREKKPVAALTPEPEPIRRQGSKGKLGPQLRFCSQMLREFQQSKKLYPMTWPFLEPVDPVKLNIPDYFNVIKKPMDLSTMRAKFTAHQYTKASEFAEDMRLMFSNCYRYNRAGTDVNEAGRKLQAEFETRYAQLPDEDEETEEHKTQVHGNEHYGYDDDEEDEEESGDEEEDEEPAPFFDDEKAEQLRKMQEMLHQLQGSIEQLTRSASVTASRRASVAGKKERRPSSTKAGKTGGRRLSTSSTVSTAKKSKAPSKLGRKTTAPAPAPKPVAPVPPAPPAVQPDCRPMTFDEKKRLSNAINRLPSDKIPRLVSIIQERIPSLRDCPQDELEIDIDALDPMTLRELDRYVTDVLSSQSKSSSKSKRAPPQPKKRGKELKQTPSTMSVASTADALADRMRRGGTPSESSSSSGSSSSSSSSEDSDSDSDALGLSEDEDKKPKPAPSTSARAQTPPAPAPTTAITGTQAAAETTRRPAKRESEVDNLITLAPGPPPAAAKPAPVVTPVPAAPVPKPNVAVKLPPTQPVVMKEVKIDNLSAWGNLAASTDRALSPVAAVTGERVAPSPPGDSTFAEFKRKALELQQKEQQARERREQEAREAELRRKQDLARKEEEERQRALKQEQESREEEEARDRERLEKERERERRREEEKKKRQIELRTAQDAGPEALSGEAMEEMMWT